MFVYEEEGRIAGLVRVEREAVRDEWTIVELDAVGMANAGEIRYRLVQQLLREGAKRAAARFHVACADADGNVELLMQAGFMRYGEERVLFRPADGALPEPWSDERAARLRDPADDRRSTRSPLARLYAVATPGPGRPARGDPAGRLGAPGRRTGASRARASTPILRFADVEGFVQASPDGGKDGTQLDGVPPGRRRQGGSAALPQGHRPARRRTSTDLVDFGLGVIAARTTRGGDHRHDHGVIAPVRTYESPIDRRLEEAGFDSIASVNLLMKETLVRVAEPALVPAGVR